MTGDGQQQVRDVVPQEYPCNLPPEIWVMIFNKLFPQDALQLAIVARFFWKTWMDMKANYYLTYLQNNCKCFPSVLRSVLTKEMTAEALVRNWYLHGKLRFFSLVPFSQSNPNAVSISYTLYSSRKDIPQSHDQVHEIVLTLSQLKEGITRYEDNRLVYRCRC